MAASIRFNGLPGPLQITPGVVSLSNFNDSGVNGWHWELLDRPLGSTAAITTPFTAASSFVADVPGSYRVRLRTYVDPGRTILDGTDIQIAFILRAAPFAWRQPAAGETTEVDPSRGWATAREKESQDTHAYLIGGLQSAFNQVSLIELGGGALTIRQSGNIIFRFNGATAKPELPSGSAASPALVFQFDTSTGIFRPTGQAFGIASGGTEVARFTASGSNLPQILVATGSNPSTHPHYSFAAAPTTGVSFANGGLALFANGQRPLLLTGIAGIPKALLQPGSASNPSLAFDGDDTTGIFRADPSVFAIATSGVERVRFENASSRLSTHWNPDVSNLRDQGTSMLRWRSIFASLAVDVSGGLLRADTIRVMTDGTAAQPAIRWDVYGDNGFFGGGADRLSVAVDGLEVMRWRNAAGANPKSLISAGSLVHPGLGFISDEDTGLYRPSFGAVGLVADALEVARFQAATGSNPQSLFAAGSAPFPAVSFLGDSDTGFFLAAPDAIGIASDSNESWRFHKETLSGFHSESIISTPSATGRLTLRGNIQDATQGVLTVESTSAWSGGAGAQQVGIDLKAVLNQTLTAGFTALRLGLTHTAIGSGVHRFADFTINGVTHFAISSGATPGRVFTNDGSVSNPIYSFLADTDTGFYRPTGGAIAAVGDGAEVVRFASPGGASPQVLARDGAEATPSYSFANDSDTGIYSVAGDDLGISVGGLLRFNVSTVAVASKLPVLVPSGTASTPSYSFTDQPNMGMYRSAIDTLAFATDGTFRVSISKTSVASTIPFLAPPGSAGAPAYSFGGDTDNGLFYVTTNTIAMAAGGIETFRWTPTVTVSSQSIEFASTDLGLPAADTVRVGVPNVSGRPRFLALKDPYFGDNFIATAFHDRQKFFLLPSGAAAMTAVGFQIATSGTVAYVTPTGTSFMTACQRNSFTTAATANSTADIRSTTPIVAQGDATTRLGFLFHARFAVGANYNANTRLFVGLINTAAVLPGGTNPGALNGNRMVGVGCNAGSTTLFVFTNDASGPPQATNTGITVAANDAFDVWIWMPPNSTVRHVYINRISGAAGTFSSSTFSFPPGANQWLHPHAWIATSEAVAKTLFVMRWAIEAGQ